MLCLDAMLLDWMLCLDAMLLDVAQHGRSVMMVGRSPGPQCIHHFTPFDCMGAMRALSARVYGETGVDDSRVIRSCTLSLLSSLLRVLTCICICTCTCTCNARLQAAACAAHWPLRIGIACAARMLRHGPWAHDFARGSGDTSR
jgi:hypothetical protein